MILTLEGSWLSTAWLSARLVMVLLGPLPATVLLLPLLFAAGLGAAIALLAVLLDPRRPAGERWATVLSVAPLLAWIVSAGLGVVALWVVTLADGLAEVTMAAGGHSYGAETWAVWLALLLGPLAMGTYYLIRLLLR